jgi:hypothetical protein
MSSSTNTRYPARLRKQPTTDWQHARTHARTHTLSSDSELAQTVSLDRSVTANRSASASRLTVVPAPELIQQLPDRPAVYRNTAHSHTHALTHARGLRWRPQNSNDRCASQQRGTQPTDAVQPATSPTQKREHRSLGRPTSHGGGRPTGRLTRGNHEHPGRSADHRKAPAFMLTISPGRYGRRSQPAL